MMTAAESMKMMETTRDMVESTRLAIDAMQGTGMNKTAKELAQALTAMLNAVAKKLDAA